MGGRGSSSGMGPGNLRNGFNGKWFGIKVTNNGGATSEYFFRKDGNTFLMRNDLGKTPKKAFDSPENIYKKAKANARSVSIISPGEVAERMKTRAEERASKPDYELGYGAPGGNREYRKTARRNRINNRRRK